MVPVLYLIYAPSGETLSAQTLVAHATSLGVAFVAASIGTWRYARARAISWRHAATYGIPGLFSAFVTARLLTGAENVHWARALFAVFLLVTATDMWRRSKRVESPAPEERPAHSWLWLGLIGIVGGAMAATLGIGGGLIAVPVLLYVGRLPIKSIAPTTLAGVCLTTLSGGLGYLTAGTAPAISPYMIGYVDLQMALPLALGATLTVPLGVRVNRRSTPARLFTIFAAVFALLGLWLLFDWYRT
jgi:uncharacterized membrane protein YfcA